MMMDEDFTLLLSKLQKALNYREDFFAQDNISAFRLFSGFYEGCESLVVDLFSKTLLLYDYSKTEPVTDNTLNDIQNYYLQRLPGIKSVIQKRRYSQDAFHRRGKITYGEKPDQQIQEYKVWYFVDLLINQDASFYLDTRNLRRWLLEHAKGWRVLNTFAYTGSLGVAALSAGASRVVQVDRNRHFLRLSRISGMLNHLDIGKLILETMDFYQFVGQAKRTKQLFDCVILDPPFFSKTKHGKVDLINENERLINKVRPLVDDGGFLILVNNALFVNGKDYIQSLEKLCQDGYLSIEKLISIPMDITGYPETVVNDPPVDPYPYNHSTKITILRVKSKSRKSVNLRFLS